MTEQFKIKYNPDAPRSARWSIIGQKYAGNFASRTQCEAFARQMTAYDREQQLEQLEKLTAEHAARHARQDRILNVLAVAVMLTATSCIAYLLLKWLG